MQTTIPTIEHDNLLKVPSNIRINYFNPNFMPPEEFADRFGQWVSIYGQGLDFPWGFSDKQYEWMEWFGEMIYSDRQSITKLALTSRDLAKTYLGKYFLAYLNIYEIATLSYFVSSHYEKVKDEMRGIRDIIMAPITVAEYGNLLFSSTTEEILFKTTGDRWAEYERMIKKHKGILERKARNNEEKDMQEHILSLGAKSKIGGSTLGSFSRGITFNHIRTEYLFLDEGETEQTLRSSLETQANWNKYQSDILPSMNTSRRRIFVAGNYTSIHGNHQKLLDSLPEEDKMILPLYNPKTGEPAWPQRYYWRNGGAYRKGMIAIDDLKEETEAQEGGALRFRKEYMASPLGDDELYYNLSKIEAIHIPEKKPLEQYKCVSSGLEYRIYRKANNTKQYVVGIDPSEGLGLDHSAISIIECGVEQSFVVATASNNTIKQDAFCASNLQFFTYFGIRPFVVPEANQGGAYIAHLEKNYPRNLIYQRETSSKVQASGLHRNTLTSRQMLAETLASHLESGALVNLCPYLHAEIQNFTNTDQTTPFRRVTPDMSIANHFDLLAATQNGVYGIEQMKKRRQPNTTPYHQRQKLTRREMAMRQSGF